MTKDTHIFVNRIDTERSQRGHHEARVTSHLGGERPRGPSLLRPTGLRTRSDEEIIHGSFVLEAEPIVINEVAAKGIAHRVATDGSRRNVNLGALPVDHFAIRYRRQELFAVLKPFAQASK
jgi:hypothetical protein